MLRSFPRKRESRTKHVGPSVAPWIPASAGMSGVDIDSIPSNISRTSLEKLLHVRLVDQNRIGKQIRPAGDGFLRLLLHHDRLDGVDSLPAHLLARDRDGRQQGRILDRDTRIG